MKNYQLESYEPYVQAKAKLEELVKKQSDNKSKIEALSIRLGELDSVGSDELEKAAELLAQGKQSKRDTQKLFNKRKGIVEELEEARYLERVLLTAITGQKRGLKK